MNWIAQRFARNPVSNCSPKLVASDSLRGAFRHIGAVEVCGRATNRVTEECRRWGIEPPGSEDVTGAGRVTFPAAIGPTAQATGQVTGQVTGHVIRFCENPRKASEIQEMLGLRHLETFVNNYLRRLLDKGWLEPTIPDTPRTSNQRYLLTEAGVEFREANIGELPTEDVDDQG
jgi:hypothetical protein